MAVVTRYIEFLRKLRIGKRVYGDPRPNLALVRIASDIHIIAWRQGMAALALDTKVIDLVLFGGAELEV